MCAIFSKIQGGLSLLVVIVVHCLSIFIGFRVFLYIITFVFDLVAFIVALTNFPYSAGCGSSTYAGCQTLKAAIGLDCVLW